MFGYQQPQRNTGDIFRQLFFGKNTLSRLILINTFVFLGVNLINVILRLSKVYAPNEISPLVYWLSVPVDLSLLIQRFWSIGTYMFLHTGFFHLLFNMIVLYFGSIIFLEFLNQRKLLYTYLVGGVVGALLYILVFNIFPLLSQDHYNSIAMGASASVLSILIAISFYAPDYSVNLFLFGRTKIKYVAIVVLLIDLIGIFSINTRSPDEINFGGHVAHIGGALWGFIYAYFLKKGNDLYSILYSIKLPEVRTQKQQEKFERYTNDSERPLTDEDFNHKKAATQEEIDRILDKISRSGYDSLSKAEKELLFKSSNKE
jgi:membrane associated rhomboid family serine protease